MEALSQTDVTNSQLTEKERMMQEIANEIAIGKKNIDEAVLENGEAIFFMGQTGSGKTTAALLFKDFKVLKII